MDWWASWLIYHKLNRTETSIPQQWLDTPPRRQAFTRSSERRTNHNDMAVMNQSKCSEVHPPNYFKYTSRNVG